MPVMCVAGQIHIEIESNSKDVGPVVGIFFHVVTPCAIVTVMCLVRSGCDV